MMTRTIWANGTIFDGTGAAPGVADIAIEDGRIVEIGAGLDGDESIDCSGHLITPGLFDCHVHFMADGDFSPNKHLGTPFSMNFYQAAERMKRTLACGITTVREAGGTDLGVKEAQEHGLIAGPRMHLSITILSQTGGHGDNWEVCGAHMPGLMDPHPGRPHNIVDGPDEMRRKVRELIRAGADVIKVCTSGGVLSPRDDPQHPHFMPDELDVLVAEATAAHRFVMAHAQATVGIKNAIRAGIRSIEHGIYLDDEAIQMMLDAGTYLVPTLVAPLGVLEAADRGVDLPPVVLDKARSVVDVHRESIRKAIDAGVKIAMGTDSGVTPHGQNLRELALMADLGMSPAATFESSTRVAAELMGLEGDLGTLEVGKIADAVMFGGTDLDVAELHPRVAKVAQAGVFVDL
ncbi:putative hydrolase [Ilumatobacter coccineus YM16-304]|uniref:Putative hydrolase n=2 Tax=Ilumatobacter coccineus TaxID=467094 RepID=A0A6C7DTU2_ILUCY|nr:amidohydrolase family protein [Ilumatobacter coccineus]BAN00394.1 putative hydrolase [Ilumatobacter coccineus YM16-304]